MQDLANVACFDWRPIDIPDVTFELEWMDNWLARPPYCQDSQLVGKTDENPRFFSSLISWEYLYFLESLEARDHFQPRTTLNQKVFSMHSRAESTRIITKKPRIFIRFTYQLIGS